MRRLFVRATLLLLPIGLAVGLGGYMVLAGAIPQPPSLTLNQNEPHFGDTVSFTAIYPKEATRSIGPRMHDNPQVQVECHQNGVRVYQEWFSFKGNETNNRDGTLTGVSNFKNMGPFNSNGMVWTGGGAQCWAALYYYGNNHEGQIHVLATTQFVVLP